MPLNTKVPIFRTVPNVREESMTAPVFMTLKDLKAVEAAHIVRLHGVFSISNNTAEYKQAKRSAWIYHAHRLVDRTASRYHKRYFAQLGSHYEGVSTVNLAFRMALFSFAVREKRDVQRLIDYCKSSQFFGGLLVFPTEYVERNPLLKGIRFNAFGEEDSGMMAPEGVGMKCEHCDGCFSSHGMRQVVTRGSYTGFSTAEWCDGCVQNDSFYCQFSGLYFNADNFRESEHHDGRSVCHSFAPHYGLLYDDYAENWYDADDQDDDDDYDNNRSQIPGYHDANRPNFVTPQVFTSPTERTYGIELEVNFVTFDDREKFFNEHFESDGLSHCEQFSIEFDGSLDDDTGIEIIGAPMALRNYHQPDSAWEGMCKLLFQAGAHGWPVRYTYGMHVNVDIRPLFTTVDHAYIEHNQMNAIATKFTAFLLNNKELTTKLAGRDTAYSSIPMMKTKSLEQAGEMLRRGKYNPVFMKSPYLMEVRIFGSNVKYEGIKRNIEYVDSGLAFIEAHPDALFGSLTTSLYRAWMLRPESKLRWPTMSAYLEPKITAENLASKRAAA